MPWHTRFRRQGKSNNATGGPIVIKGKLLQGIRDARRFKGAGCYISAYDADTGQPAWRFNTIAREGQPGGDTWGTLPKLLRAGGDTWITGSYDPESQPHLLGHRPGQTLVARQPRHEPERQSAVHQFNPRA